MNDFSAFLTCTSGQKRQRNSCVCHACKEADSSLTVMYSEITILVFQSNISKITTSRSN